MPAEIFRQHIARVKKDENRIRNQFIGIMGALFCAVIICIVIEHVPNADEQAITGLLTQKGYRDMSFVEHATYNYGDGQTRYLVQATSPDGEKVELKIDWPMQSKNNIDANSKEGNPQTEEN